MARGVTMYQRMNGSLHTANVVNTNEAIASFEGAGWFVGYDTIDDAFDAAEGTNLVATLNEEIGKWVLTPEWRPAISPITPPNPFYALLDRMRAIHDAKNADYAASTDRFRNFRQSAAVGVPPHIGAYIRLGDKYMRAANLLKREQETGGGAVVTDESVEDTLMDLAIYSLIVLELHREYRAGGTA